MMTSSGISTADDNDDDDGDGNERVLAAEEMDSSVEISGCVILLMDDMIVQCLIIVLEVVAWLDNMRLFRFRCVFR